MSKPEDIPQDVWLDASQASDMVSVYSVTPFKPTEIIARAILAAEKRGEEREREACAEVVETFTPVRPAFVTEDEGGIKWPHPAVQQPIYSPEKLATAIRKRGEA